ncbi:MAG TPA: sulfate adenylyltransferase, partial [Actinomycetes bacterium]
MVDRRLDGEAAGALGGVASLVVTPAEQADLRALATGAYSPLTGFMGAKQHQSVLESMRLPDGLLWPIPVCLGLPDGLRVDGGRLALRDREGRLLGMLEVAEVFDRDRTAEAQLVYGTTDPEHPGVTRVLGSPARAVAGPIQAV